MIKKFIALTAFLFFAFLPQKALALEFATSYDVLYDIGEDGVASVTQKITFKNLTSEYYANQYKLIIGGSQIFDMKASDPGGPLQITNEQKDNSTIINVKFNQQVAGIGKTLPWTLSFKSKNFAEKIGKVWEVRIPKISSSNLAEYNLTIAAPQSFGQLSAITPTPKSQTVSQGKVYLTFDLSQLKESGVSVNFGENQLFDFDLNYYLENKNLLPILTNIALPPDTSYQDIIYQRIDPKPLNVTVDNDGNYLAWYRLNRGQKVDVKVIGSAKLYSNSKVKSPFLEDSLKKKYTESQKYWEKDNPLIVNKVNEILGENSSLNTSQKAKLIFDFVVNYLKYDSSRIKDSVERFGAVTALNNPDSSVCMEFTDLFIALTRAAGIPSRELDGYAYTANAKIRPLSLTKDVLHSWPEYWDDTKGWVMVDPTWENTTGGVDYFNKLDLNHFVFVIKGSSSIEPIPAGSYKFFGKDSDDVKVTLTESNFLGKPQIDVQIDSSDPILAGFPSTVKVTILNSGNAFYPANAFTLNSGQLSILNGGKQNSGIIPAFGTATFSFDTRTKSIFDNYSDQIIFLIGGQKFTKEISIKPFFLFQNLPLIVGGVIGLMLVTYFGVLGSHLYFAKKTSSSGKEIKSVKKKVKFKKIGKK